MNSQLEKIPEVRAETKVIKGSRWYFSRRAERNFFFVLTVIMLLWGMLVKLGVL